MGNRWPVTISTVVVCDLYVCVMRMDRGFCFPWAVLDWGEESTEEACAQHLDDIMHLDRVDKPICWLPIDIRSTPGRPSFLPDYSMDIGYMTILASSDLCDFRSGEFEWQLVNFEEDGFPRVLCGDHLQLWTAAQDMIRIIR